jgi:hypothetical protein
MEEFHNVVGTVVILAFAADLVAHLLVFLGRPATWLRGASIAAATALLLQYLVGFTLLADGRDNAGSHYVFALLPILTVGLEHGFARTRPTARERGLWGLIATAGTLALVVIAYVIGTSNA